MQVQLVKVLMYVFSICLCLFASLLFLGELTSFCAPNIIPFDSLSLDWCLLSAVQPNKIYISGLPEHTRREDLQSCFGKIGNIVNIELKCVDCQSVIFFLLQLPQSWLWFCGMLPQFLRVTVRNLTLGRLPKRASPSIMKACSWETKFVSNYPMVEGEQPNIRVILEPVSNVDSWAIGQGRISLHSALIFTYQSQFRECLNSSAQYVIIWGKCDVIHNSFISPHRRNNHNYEGPIVDVGNETNSYPSRPHPPRDDYHQPSPWDGRYNYPTPAHWVH